MSLIKQLSIICSTLLLIAILHISGVYLRLYWRIPIYDTVLHAMGGAWVVLSTLLILPHLPLELRERKNLVLSGLSIVIIIGVLWEIFEVAIGFSIIDDPKFLVDTITDLCADIIGGGIILSLWKQKKQH
jgi:hypothetical protein